MANDLEGQVAVVTGGGRGFGRAIAEGFAAAGAAVTVTSRTQAQLDEVVAAIEQAGGRALAVVGDVTIREDVERVKRETEAAFGPVTTVVHNAGVPWPFGPVWDVDPDRWWEAQAIHVRGAMLHMNAYVPGMIERGGGRVIVVSSIAGTGPRPNLSGYGVAKNSQIRLVEHLGLEGREHNVFTWSIQPGTVVTELAEMTMADPGAQKYMGGFVDFLHQLKEEADPQIGLRRCAELCIELASGRCDALTGRFLTPDDDLAVLVEEAKAQAAAG